MVRHFEIVPENMKSNNDRRNVGLGYVTREPESLVGHVGAFLTLWFGLKRPIMQNQKIYKIHYYARNQ